MTKIFRAPLLISALVFSLGLPSAPAAFGQDKMGKDGMSKDPMSKDSMKKAMRCRKTA